MSESRKTTMTYIGRRIHGGPMSPSINHVWLEGEEERYFQANWKGVWIGYTYEFEISNEGKTFKKGNRTADPLPDGEIYLSWQAGDEAAAEFLHRKREEKKLAAIPRKELDAAFEPLRRLYRRLDFMEQHYFAERIARELRDERKPKPKPAKKKVKK